LLSKDGDGRVLGGRPRPRPLLRDIRHVNVALSERVSVTDTYLEAGGGVFLLSAALLRLPCLGSSSSSSSSSTSSLMHKSNDHHHHYLDSHYTLVLHQCRRASPLYVVSSLLLILIISIGKGLLTWKLSHGSATRPIQSPESKDSVKSSSNIHISRSELPFKGVGGATAWRLAIAKLGSLHLTLLSLNLSHNLVKCIITLSIPR
jgi:hypothetical protein